MQVKVLQGEGGRGLIIPGQEWLGGGEVAHCRLHLQIHPGNDNRSEKANDDHSFVIKLVYHLIFKHLFTFYRLNYAISTLSHSVGTVFNLLQTYSTVQKSGATPHSFIFCFKDVIFFLVVKSNTTPGLSKFSFGYWLLFPLSNLVPGHFQRNAFCFNDKPLIH